MLTIREIYTFCYKYRGDRDSRHTSELFAKEMAKFLYTADP